LDASDKPARRDYPDNASSNHIVIQLSTRPVTEKEIAFGDTLAPSLTNLDLDFGGGGDARGAG
jgi:hypothetical protein